MPFSSTTLKEPLKHQTHPCSNLKPKSPVGFFFEKILQWSSISRCPEQGQIGLGIQTWLLFTGYALPYILSTFPISSGDGSLILTLRSLRMTGSLQSWARATRIEMILMKESLRDLTEKKSGIQRETMAIINYINLL
jgi:hypothetical protein